LDQERTVLVSANIYKRGFSEVADDIDKVIAQMDIPKDYVVRMSGERKEMEESFKSLLFALILSITLVYMIMAAQFESLWQPFIIMFTVPLSIIGVTFALLLTNTTLNVVVFLGMIILGGIVVNNGIVLIDRINGLRREGYTPFDAVLEACQNRLRPILMTALTTTLGLLPLALGIGEGAELRAPMAITVIGGLSSSTFLTLFVVPALYLIVVGGIDKLKRKEKRRKRKERIKKKEERRKEVIVIAPLPEEKEVKEEEIEGTEAKIEEEELETLNERQRRLLEYLKQNKRITRKQYMEMFGVSTATAARDIRELQEMGLIIAKGPNGPGRWFELNKR
jgi:HAE1 family hydrophobic/amphiphilic exporter-1